jgi:hypothetical protein
MTNTIPNRHPSLGILRINDNKTKDKSPDVKGTICIKRDLLLELHKQLTDADDSEVVACLTGWFYDDSKGRYTRVQLSAKPKRLEYRDENPFWDFR